MGRYLGTHALRRAAMTDRAVRAVGARPPDPQPSVRPDRTEPLGGCAVVIGASIAGTLAARVLSESYREVVVVDRDEVLGVNRPRRGVPHSAHTHRLHARGYLILAELFPNLLEQVRDLPGLTVRDWSFDGKPADTGLLSIAGSRPVLENHLRSKVAARHNVTYLQSTEMLGLLYTDDQRRVIGLRLRERGTLDEYPFEADLVVDATGHASRTPGWLEEMGYERPAEERIEIRPAARDAEPTSDAVSFTFPASVWRHYERLTRFPERLLVIGDALCSVNPVHGQGMAVAGLQVMALRTHLRSRSTPDPLTLFADFARLIENPWHISTSADLEHPDVVGKRPLSVRLFNAVMARLRYAATKDAAATAALMRITGLVDPPRALWRPGLLARVLWLSRDQPPVRPAATAVVRPALVGSAADASGGHTQGDRAEAA